MTTAAWIIVDDAVAVLSAIAWFAAGVTMALRRARLVLAVLAVALSVTFTRVATVTVLAGRGWWFVQEKLLLGLPMIAVAAVAATVLAGRGLRARNASLPRAENADSTGIVALFSTGYAALASFVVTFLVGYPLTAGTALITIALVITGTLLTVRVIATPAALTVVGHRPQISRRRFLSGAGGVVVIGTAGAGAGLSVRPGPALSDGDGPAPSSHTPVSVTELMGAETPAPGGVRREHVLTARKATISPASGGEVEAWTFDGTSPGPTISAIQGDLIEVRLVNQDIDDGVTLHWHGYDVPCGEDGVAGITQEAVTPGNEFVYRFRADRTGTYWYHTHFASYVGVARGLYGALVVKPRPWQGADEIDRTLSVHTFGGTATVAGGEERIAPAGTPVRLRLINTDPDPHHFALAGTSFRVAAVDGRDLNGPGEISRTRLRLAAAGRFDLVFIMPDTAVTLILDNDPDGTVLFRSHGDSESSTQDIPEWPELDLLTYGTPASVALRTAAADRHFTLVLDRGLAVVDGSPAYGQIVNGRAHPSIPDQLVANGDVVRFTVVNRSLDTHPWHLHGHSVLILSRNGKPSSGSPLWVDTFEVRPGEVWEVVFRAANPGIWMNHCHNLPHVRQGMMLRLRYDGVMTPFDGMHMDHPSHDH